MVDYRKDYATFIALAIEKNLEEINLGSTDSTFVDHVSMYAPLLDDASNIQDASLNSAWNFADQFFFSFAHNDRKMAGIEWNKAFSLIQDIVTKLKNGDPITEPTVLTFQHPIHKTK